MRDTVAYTKHGSYSAESNHNFAETVALNLVKALKDDFENEFLDIGAYTPPYDEDEIENAVSPEILVLAFTNKHEQDVLIGINFGVDNTDLVRNEFEKSEWENAPQDPHSSGIIAANFDEAWRIICLTAAFLKIKRITISYGC